MNLSKGDLTINNKNHKVIVFNQKMEDLQESKTKNVNCLHHIHIIDRSGSMSRDIEELIENVKLTIDFMSDNDFVTIIWFSSEGRYATLVKAARKDDYIKTLLDTIKSTLGCTCFSDPLNEVNKIIEETSAICDNFNITLFTDGEPVTSWSEREEVSRIFKAIDQYKDKVMAINTIGYGYYYNKDLLLDIAKTSEFGEMIHSSKISEYSSIFSHNYEKISDLVLAGTEIKAPIGSKIMYLNTYSSKLSDNEMKMKLLEKRKNQFIIIGPDENDFNFQINEDTFNSSQISSLVNEKTKINILYGLAYQYYYNGDRKQSLDILLNDIGDKALIDSQMKAFTIDEVAEYTKQFKKCVFKPRFRYKDGEVDNSYLPAKDAFCVIDLLSLLIENKAKYVYSSNYKRIGRKTEDTFNIFKWDSKLHTTNINELVFNDKELNISIRNSITGKVSLNPKVAKKVDLPLELKSKIYRNQTIIKDGNLNMDIIDIITDEKCKDIINEKNNDLIIACNKLEEYEDKYLLQINLSLLPVINQTYCDEKTLSAKHILEMVNENNKLNVEQKVVKHLLSEIKDEVIDYGCFNEEQIEVLKDHGLSADLVYGGLNNITADKNEDDYYVTRQLSYKIKGEASLPSVNSILKLKNPPTSGIKLYLYNMLEQYRDELEQIDDLEESKEFLENKLSELKSKLLFSKVNLNCSKLAIVLTGNWIKDLVVNDKGDYEYFDKDTNTTLIVQTEKVKKYI